MYMFRNGARSGVPLYALGADHIEKPLPTVSPLFLSDGSDIAACLYSWGA
jgi:hypothetical protein